MKSPLALLPVPTPDPLAVVTTGTGYFRPGLRGRIVAGAERVVHLGPVGAEDKHVLPEFTVELAGRPRPFCQYGRDFVFADGAPLESKASSAVASL